MNSSYNGDISRWNVSNVQDMSWMFAGTAFNGVLALWDVRSVQDFNGIFQGVSFAQDISMWPVSQKASIANMYDPHENKNFLAKQGMSPWVVAMHLIEEVEPVDEDWRRAFVEVEDMAKALSLSVHEQATCIVDKYKQLMGLGPIVDSIDGSVFSTLQS